MTGTPSASHLDLPPGGHIKVAIVGGPEDTETVMEPPRARHFTVDGNEASLHFLRSYIKNGRDSALAKENMEPDHTPSLAGVYLKQFLKRERNLECEVLHRYQPFKPQELVDLVQGASLLLVSTTVMTSWDFPEKIAAAAKAANPQLTVIAGGVGIYKKYHAMRKLESGALGLGEFEASVLRKRNKVFMLPTIDSAFDFLIISAAGERTLLSLIDSLVDGGDAWKTMPNVCWYDKDIQNFHVNQIVEELGNDVYVDWSQEKLPTGVVYPVQVSQGCPFRCGFCDFAAIAPKIRQAPLSVVIEMLEHIPLEDGKRNVYFTNENLLYNHKWTLEFLNEVIKRDLKLNWRSFLRIDSIQEPEIADLVKRSGCAVVLPGVESASPIILSNMNKHCTSEKIMNCISLLLNRGIMAHISLIVGYPGETEETLANTIALLNSLPDTGIVLVKIFDLFVLPMSPLSTPQERARHGLQGFGNMWRHSTMDSDTARRLTAESYDKFKINFVGGSLEERVISHKFTDEQLRDFFLTRNILYRRQANLPIPGGDTYGPTEQLFEHLLELVAVS